MEVNPLLLQFAGSLIAIFALYWLAKSLGLGRGDTPIDESKVQDIASEIEDGFVAKQFSISTEGDSLLAQDSAGRIMLIKRHGNKFAGRILASTANASLAHNHLVVDSGERRFGTVQLALPNAAYWADAIKRI